MINYEELFDTNIPSFEIPVLATPPNEILARLRKPNMAKFLR